MSTRGMIRIYDNDGSLLVNIYVHGDMYPHGIPFDIFEFITKKKLTNGITPGEHFNVFNSMGDLAAQIITFLKNSYSNMVRRIWKEISVREAEEGVIAAGGIYVTTAEAFPPEQLYTLFWVEYFYEIHPNRVIIYKTNDTGAEKLFDGSWVNAMIFCDHYRKGQKVVE